MGCAGCGLSRLPREQPERTVDADSTMRWNEKSVPRYAASGERRMRPVFQAEPHPAFSLSGLAPTPSGEWEPARPRCPSAALREIGANANP